MYYFRLSLLLPTLALGWFIATIILIPSVSLASTLSVSPSTAVYPLGTTFTASVVLNTKGAPVNAADATLSFNPKELVVVSLTKGSTFSLWTAEPSFSNSAGTISFSGGTPAGYTGGNGVIISVVFRTLTAATARVSITGGSVLAADGRGTNVLTSMGGGTYTVSAATVQPTPEVIVEYVPPANTPAAPTIESTTHPKNGWSKESTAKLSWSLPAGVTGLRTALDTNPSAIPTKVYETPQREISIPDLEDGISYFHLQFRNADGWGKIAHYRLAVDDTTPTGLSLSLPPDANTANPTQTLLVTGTSSIGAPLEKYKVQVNGGDPFEVLDAESTGKILLPTLSPGYQTVVVEVFDAAGNSTIISHSFTIESFAAPRFTNYPPELTLGVIPVLTGETRPKAVVTVTLQSGSAEPRTYSVTASDVGTFTFIPDGPLPEGIHSLYAVATDEFGAVSAPSESIKIAVQPSGIVRIGTMIVSILSVLISLLALLVLLVLSVWYSIYRFRHFRSLVRKESNEVSSSIDEQFARVLAILSEEEAKLLVSRKTNKLTASEAQLITNVRNALVSAEQVVEKEADDVTRMVAKT